MNGVLHTAHITSTGFLKLVLVSPNADTVAFHRVLAGNNTAWPFCASAAETFAYNNGTV